MLSIAITSKHTTGRMRPSGVKVNAGTVLLVPGMTEEHFDRAHREDRPAEVHLLRLEPVGRRRSPAVRAVGARAGMTVKLHSGGVSPLGFEPGRRSGRGTAVEPDVVGHISGGPIPPPDSDIIAIIAGLPDTHVEVCSSNNYRATTVVVDELRRVGRLDRLTLGTDTPAAPASSRAGCCATSAIWPRCAASTR